MSLVCCLGYNMLNKLGVAKNVEISGTNLFLFKLSIQSVQVQVSAVNVATENEEWNAQNQVLQ